MLKKSGTFLKYFFFKDCFFSSVCYCKSGVFFLNVFFLNVKKKRFFYVLLLRTRYQRAGGTFLCFGRGAGGFLALSNQQYYAVKKVFVKFFAKFSKFLRSFSKFSQVFWDFRELFEAFGSIRTHWDALGCIRKQLEAFGRFRFFFIFWFFWIFESFFDVSGRNFYKRLFSRHNSQLPVVNRHLPIANLRLLISKCQLEQRMKDVRGWC